ncbi:MAG: hypothetical protein ACTHMI_24205 [Mucilaginibacter sp.]
MRPIILPFFLLLAACQRQDHQVQDFIPGTYVCRAQSPYSIADDTIVIVPNGVLHYDVFRKTGYQRINNGILSPVVRKAKNFTGIWDADKQQMQVDPVGVIILFQPAAHQLTIQRTIYKKIQP